MLGILRRGFCLILFFCFSPQLFGEEVVEYSLIYKVRVAFLDAGDLSFQLLKSRNEYSFLGRFETSGVINRYYSWKGDFAAIGLLVSNLPKMTRYYSKSVSKDHDLKVVILKSDSVRILEAELDEVESLTRPRGDDLLSALFFSPKCYTGDYMNDGQDVFEVDLLKTSKNKLKQSEPYRSIERIRCLYKVRDYNGRTRKVTVTIDETEQGFFAKQVRIKVPLLPDILFELQEITWK